MARIRSIKPDHGTNKKVGKLSDRAYRIWVAGMITQADDEGRFKVDYEETRARVFGYHPEVSIEDVSEAVGEIIQSGLMAIGEIEGKLVGALHDWSDHQTIDRPKKSTLPQISNITHNNDQIRRTIATDRDSSTNDRERSRLIDEEGRKEGRKEKEKEKKPAFNYATPLPKPVDNFVDKSKAKPKAGLVQAQETERQKPVQPDHLQAPDAPPLPIGEVKPQGTEVAVQDRGLVPAVLIGDCMREFGIKAVDQALGEMKLKLTKIENPIAWFREACANIAHRMNRNKAEEDWAKQKADFKEAVTDSEWIEEDQRVT